ncbi:zinc ABC transporter substrate-binding protein [Acinetobacter corruptisaponis]|uniref:Zinc ABC transporter substrate-binding protein n=1 Tax=Acinetobacter corruptisaponis TaxID=3045147 RepID=A0ABY8S2W1_9GAMM|nr:zinc ABC transporter substrate-binding protein [Acinetobacter sp. KCTC 92772]WHP05403.1 zinc ABC transporter substrate-binding protein [Acinetobacter sp. KCTC 92772]
MDKKELVAALRNLNLPLDQFIVVGGGVLTVHGIRETEDIDIVVTPDLFTILRQSWTLKTRPNGKPGLHKGCVEAYLDVNCETFEKTTEWLLFHSDIVEGIHFIDLKTLAGFKAGYGREKDISDLKLIVQYIGNLNIGF